MLTTRPGTPRRSHSNAIVWESLDHDRAVQGNTLSLVSASRPCLASLAAKPQPKHARVVRAFGAFTRFSSVPFYRAGAPCFRISSTTWACSFAASGMGSMTSSPGGSAAAHPPNRSVCAAYRLVAARPSPVVLLRRYRYLAEGRIRHSQRPECCRLVVSTRLQRGRLGNIEGGVLCRCRLHSCFSALVWR